MNTSVSVANTAKSLRDKAALAVRGASRSLEQTQALRMKAGRVVEAEADKPETALGDAEREAFREELLAQIARVCKKHHIDVEFGDMSVSEKRGIMHLPLRMVTQAYNKLRKANPYFRERGQTQAEMRFSQYHEEAGLKETDLHERFPIDGILYELLGLKGRSHKVVLKPVNTTDKITPIEVPAQDFRSMIGRA